MDKAKIGPIACAAGALLILLSVFTKSWFSESEGKMSMGIGLWSAEICFGDECKSESMSASEKGMKGGDKAFVYVGKINFLIGLAATGLLGLLAFAGFTQKKDLTGKFGKFGMIAAGVFLLFSLVFLFLKPESFDKIGVGFSFFMALLGGIGGIVGSKFVASE